MTVRRAMVGAAVLSLGMGLGLGLGATGAGADPDGGKLDFEDFVGVSAAQTGPAGAIRGINGGGLPWGIGEAEVTARSSGRIDVEFEDLVFLAGPNVGKNTVPSMAVVVTCLDDAGVVVKARSATFPVSVVSATDGGGDAEARTTIELPASCHDPIALITNAAGTVWFAASGVDG